MSEASVNPPRVEGVLGPPPAQFTIVQKMAPDLGASLDFAQRVFANSQELIRFMDQKATSSLTTLGALVGALGILGGVVVPRLGASQLAFTPTSFMFVIGCVAGIVFALQAAGALSAAFHVYRPRGLDSKNSEPGFIFPLSVQALAKGDSRVYAHALASASKEEMLASYAQQVVALSGIYAAKHEAVGTLLNRLRYVVATWLTAVLSFAAAVVLR